MTKRSQEEFRASLCAKKWMDGLNDRLVACSLLIDQAGKSIEAKQDDSPAEILDSGKLWRALLDLDQARSALNEVIKKIERVSNQPLANG
jgi:signal transduction histidine kinase